MAFRGLARLNCYEKASLDATLSTATGIGTSSGVFKDAYYAEQNEADHGESQKVPRAKYELIPKLKQISHIDTHGRHFRTKPAWLAERLADGGGHRMNVILRAISPFAPSLTDSGVPLGSIPSVEQAVMKPCVAAEIMFLRPLKRAGDVLTFRQPQSRDWGHLLSPAKAG